MAATSYPTCWTRNVTVSSSSNHPYIASTNYSSPGSLYFYSYNNSRVVAVCNPIDQSIPINTLTVEFKMKYSSLDANGIQVGVMSDLDDFSTFVPVGEPQLLSETDTWEDKVVILSSYTGTGAYIALAAISPASQYARAYVDDFVLDYTPSCPGVYGLSTEVISTTSISVDWDNSFVDPAGWNIAYSQTSIAGFDPATIIIVAPTETIPYTISGLTAGETYTFAVQNGCGGNWSSFKEITLPSSAITLPYYQDFEDLSLVSEWEFASSNPTPNKTDMWCIGSATGNSMYVSSDNGVTNSYSEEFNYVYSTALVEFGESPEFTLNFDWKALGEIGYDRLSVYSLPLSSPMPSAGYPIGGKILLSPIGGETTWQNKTITLSNAEYSNTTQRIIFVWYSDISTIVNPPAAIDNIRIFGVDCAAPTNLQATSVTQTSATIEWTEIGSATSWNLYYKESTSLTYDSIFVSNLLPLTINNLSPNTLYDMYIVANCGSESSNISPIANFRTECAPITSLPYIENFDSYGIGSSVMPACWVRNTTYLDRPNISLGGHNGSNCLYFYAGQGTYNIAVMTPIDVLIPVNTLMARFYYKNYNASDELTVGVMTDPLDATTFVAIQTIQASTTSTWAEYEVSFDSYTGYGQYIAFKNTAVVSSSYGYLDDLTVDIIPACTRPGSLSAIGITSTSANITFVPGESSDTDWKIYYKALGDISWDESDVISVPYQLTGLTPNTEYEVYMTTLCDDGAYSDASQIYVFRTECTPLTSLPYSENFDSYLSGSSAMPDCWVRNSNYSNRPQISSSGYSGNCLYFYAPSSGTYNIGVMTLIDGLIPINTLIARFYYKNNYSTDRLVVGVMTDPIDATTFDSITTIQAPTTSTWEQYEVNFSSYAGLGKYIAFKNEFTTTSAFGYIDDLLVDFIPACARPTSVSAAGSGVSMNVTFLPGNSTDTEWYIYFKPVTETNWDSVYTNTLTTTINNLIVQTNYEIYVKTSCSEGSLSEASQIINYTTPCSDIAISSFPWTEGFETGLICWQQDYVLGTVDWESTSLDEVAHTGTQFAFFSDESWGGYKTKLISPVLDITGLSQPYLSFWHKQKAWGSDQDKLKVFYRTGLSGTWTELIHYTTSIPSYVLDSIALPNASATYQIAFEGEQNWAHGVAVDDITVYDLGSLPCSEPTNIVVAPLNNSALVTWTPGGGELSWEIRLEENGAIELTTDTSLTLTGLISNTEYTVYVRSNCGLNYSSWVPTQFTTTNVFISPVVTTTVLTAQIAETTAIFNGIYIEGTESIQSKGFEYKTVIETTWTDQSVVDQTTPFTYNATGLSSNTDYQAKAYVVTATDGRTYGNIVDFTTLTIIPPTVTTDSVGSITQNSAAFYGKITENTEAIQARGFEYKLNTDEWEDAINISASGTTIITATPTILQQGLEYNFRAYARTFTETTYGLPLTFGTLGINDIDGNEILIMIYPNPAESNTNLIISGISGETKIILSDVQGRILNTIKAKPLSGVLEQSIDLNNLAKGVYYIRIQNSDINRTQKLIIK